MPARSKRQQKAAGADVARGEAGQPLKTFPDLATARKFARAPGGTLKGLPAKVARDRSTRGSPAFSPGELAQGFRRVGAGT